MRGKPFEPGNKYGHGRPPGSRNKDVNVLQSVLDGYGDALVKKCLFLALQGNITPLRLCFQQLFPARQQRSLQFKLPAIKSLTDLASASEMVVRGVSRGRLTPSERQAFTIMLDGQRRMIETLELEARLRALEEDRVPSVSKEADKKGRASKEEDSKEGTREEHCQTVDEPEQEDAKKL